MNITASHVLDKHRLQAWLAGLDAAPLECDGMTRCISILLQRDRVRHEVHRGDLVVHGAGTITPHWWIRVGNGLVCDFRARMWLGQPGLVPHGVFRPEEHVQYRSAGVEDIPPSPLVFHVLAGVPLDTYPRLSALE